MIETNKQNLNCELVNCDLRQTFGCKLIDWDVKKNKQPLIVNWLFVIWQKKKLWLWFEKKQTDKQTFGCADETHCPNAEAGASPDKMLSWQTAFTCLHFIRQRLQRGSWLVRSLSPSLPCTPLPHILYWFPIFPRMPFSSGKTRAANLPHEVKAKRHSDTSGFELRKCEGSAQRWGVTKLQILSYCT